MDAYLNSVAQVQIQKQVDVKVGLTAKEAAQRLIDYGPNSLREAKKKTWFQMFLAQFKDFLVLILLLAAGISIITGLIGHEGLVDGFIILAIVLLNAILGVTQERKASDALSALRKMSSPHAKVIRDGVLSEISATQLVPGDIVYLETGDSVPADIRLFSSTNFKIDESTLTGESLAVEKDATIDYEHEMVLAERKNVAFMSTLVTYGKAYGIVDETGMNTEIGMIAEMLDRVEDAKTPLQKTIDQFAKILGLICIGVSVFVFILGLAQQKQIFDIFLTAIALAVAAIPEGLTAVITVVLALGMQRMVKRHAIIKNLSTVETLGQATIICSDKTGTLTQNEMTVLKVYDNQKEYMVTGVGYRPEGQILDGENPAQMTHNLDIILKTALLCNDAAFDVAHNIIGDPTEGALLVLAAKGGLTQTDKRERYPQLNEYPFDSTRKMMTSIHQIDERILVLTKGAPDQLIKRCNRIQIQEEIRTMTEEDIARILAQNDVYSQKAFRVLGFAYRETDQPKAMDLENQLIFVGLTAMLDPARKEAKAAIHKCHQAGIRVMMITGDHLTTAKAIASELGILKEGHQALSGEDTTKMTEAEFSEAILRCDVFARSTPRDKLRIVEILQKNHEVVAMTGDGVNDAPALKQADIGIAMGITGTEVSKEASNMILTDDNFTSIVSAVEEGRIIYSNIRKFTTYLVSCNIGEILIIVLAMIFGVWFDFHIPLLAIHLLWINLMTDSFPAFALGIEKGEPNIMDELPRATDEKLLNKTTLIKIAFQGIGLMLAALVSFYIGLKVMPQASVPQARTMIFVTIIIGELLRTYSARSETKFLFQMNPFDNRAVNYAVVFSLALLLMLVYVPFLASIFRIEALTIGEFLIAAVLGLLPMVAGELTKLYQPRH